MKKVLWYTLVVPLSIVFICFDFLRTIPAAWLATGCVIEQLLERYEYWSFDVSRDSFVNHPWRWSLWTTWKTAFNNAICTHGDPRW